nr:hypothetical protein CFP56_08667 [Quercus suber]
MSSMRFNAPSSSSSMNCTYPPTNKSSKQRKHNGNTFKWNKRIGTPLFFLHSSPPSLQWGCCCRHYGQETLHLSLIEHETGLGYDHDTGRIDDTDELWGRKLKARLQQRKNAWTPSGQIPKESTEGSRDSIDNKEFVDPQCQPSVDVDLMEVEGPSLSRTGPTRNKGKGLARGVHLFRGIHKKCGKKCLIVQEMSDSLKNILDVIFESRSVSTRTPFVSTTVVEVQPVMDMVLSLLGVQPGDHLHMFSSYFFMGNQEARHMFAAHSH